MKKFTGFTLIETMVAITILTLAISGSFLTANNAMVAANIARDRLTASYLAQEGVEYMRWMRDNEYLSAYHTGGANVSVVAWNNFLNGLTNHSYDAGLVGAPTPFTRTVQETSVSATEESIVSTVSWSFHNILYSVAITDHLTPWQ
jgi:prepilin-type N-terminal cleavage/methylation domain-containing protein